MYRLFVAIDLSEEAKNVVTGLCTGIGSARWVDPEQLHLTLRFIGSVDEQTFQSIKQELHKINAPPFSLKLQGIGCFPMRGAPRVLWVGIEGGEELQTLQAKIENGLQKARVPAEKRPFSPHITIARFKEKAGKVISAYLEGHRSFNLPPFPVSEFFLYSSTLTASGAIHKREEVYALR